MKPTYRSVMSQVVEPSKKMSDKSRYIFVIFRGPISVFSFIEIQVTPTVSDAVTEVVRDVETKLFKMWQFSVIYYQLCNHWKKW